MTWGWSRANRRASQPCNLSKTAFLIIRATSYCPPGAKRVSPKEYTLDMPTGTSGTRSRLLVCSCPAHLDLQPPKPTFYCGTPRRCRTHVLAHRRRQRQPCAQQVVHVNVRLLAMAYHRLTSPQAQGRLVSAVRGRCTTVTPGSVLLARACPGPWPAAVNSLSGVEPTTEECRMCGPS